MFGGESIIEPVQLRLLFADDRVWGIFVHLQVNELMHAVPQFHHAPDAFNRGVVQVGLNHAGILPVVHLAVHHGVRVVFYIRVCREGCINGFALS
ncbi:hypothetical protein SDC9_49864 [bioreactor metagenome]|uniref:Uncharacterized protein n=1 Tax=bioreactor metagenome TaxID=1076179 RepID=A0A644WJ49_9ZZZZ